MNGPSAEIVLEAQNIVVKYPAAAGGVVHAVSGVDLSVHRGETLGIVGESGCGKSSLARALIHLPPPSSGTVTLEGRHLGELSRSELRSVRPSLQMIYQDPISSLNPRRTVERIVGEPLRAWEGGDRQSRRQRVNEALDAVGLDPATAGGRHAHELSGGQRQRVSIARALVLEPTVLICDEPVSALDVSVQAAVLNLLRELRAERDLTMVFISHDLSVIKNISDRVAVLYLGHIVEIAAVADLFDQPRHWYTRGLISAIPVPDPAVQPVDEPVVGELPSPLDPPSGCRFRTRCEHATQLCEAERPPLVELSPAHWVACHHPAGEVPVVVQSNPMEV